MGEEDTSGAETTKVLDLVDAFRLQETPFDKKEFVGWLKGFMKKVKGILEESNPDRVEGFKKGANEFSKWAMANYDEFTFYTGESMDCENGIVMSYWKEDAHTPTFLYFKDGMKEVKY